MRLIACLGWVILLSANVAFAAEPKPATNGFDLSAAAVPTDQIFGGGPAKDEIAAVDEPVFVSPSEASWVKPETPVLAVSVGDETHIYPVHLMEYHQIVNDLFGDVPVLVSYDPLAGVPRAFLASVAGKSAKFGVSGLIHNHGFLFYDRGSQSLWQQFNGRAVSGSLVGTTLGAVSIRQETLAGVLARHPRASVLTRPSPETNNYAQSPFRRYWDMDKFIFPVAAEDRSYHLKEMVLGVIVDGKQRAYLGSVATAAGGKVEDEFSGKRIRFVYDPDSATFAYEVPEGLQVVEAYWLAWKAFFPETEVWQP